MKTNMPILYVNKTYMSCYIGNIVGFFQAPVLNYVTYIT